MTRTFALDRIAAAITVLFLVALWLPLAVFGGWDALRRPPEDEVRTFLFGLCAVGVVGVAWSLRFLRPRVLLTEDLLIERTAFGRREVPLDRIVKMERVQTRRHQTLIHDLTLTLSGDARPVVIDLNLVRRPDELLAELKRRARAPFTDLRERRH